MCDEFLAPQLFFLHHRWFVRHFHSRMEELLYLCRRFFKKETPGSRLSAALGKK